MEKILAGLAAVVLMTPWLGFGQAGPAEASVSVSAEHELIKAENDWNDALIRRDAALLEPLMAQDYIATDAAGTVETRAQTLADVKSGDLRLASAVNDEYKIHAYGDAAVVNYRATIKGRFKGMDISGQYRETDMWVKRGAHWECVAAHFSKLG